jgi:hypothetical protein
MIHRIALPRLVLLLALLAPLFLAQHAHAQRGGFNSLFRPMSIEDLRSMSDDLELSRQQQAAIMPLYDRYMNEFELLQDKQIAEVVDSGITMGQKMWSFGGGQITIPPRKELEELVENVLDIYTRINRIDSTFFDGVKMTLKIEDQLPMLDRYHRQRTLSVYVIPHFLLASRINEGIQFNMLAWLDRQQLTPQQQAAVRMITDEFEVQMLRFIRNFEDELGEIVEAVLDMVDEMGLRDMNMQQMMAMAADGLENRMKTFFDEESKAMQKTCEKMSSLNLQTARRLREVLPEELWVKMTMEYADDAYGSAGRTNLMKGESRFSRAMKLDGVSEGQIAALEQARTDYRVAWIGLFPRISNALENQRAYRTADQFEGDAPGPHDEQVDQSVERVEELIDGVEITLAGILTAEQLALLNGDKEQTDRWGRSRRARAVEQRQESESGGRTYDFPVAAMEPVSIEQFSSWLKLEDVDQVVLESLYDEYALSYEQMADEYNDRLTNGYAALEDEGSWRDRRRIRREARDQLLPQLEAAEDAFFEDMQMVLPEDTMPDLLNQIRISHDRARRREKIWMGNWSLRGQTEAAIDIGEVIMAIDPVTLDEQTRSDLLDAMIGYNAACETDMAAMEKAYDSVKSLESRLWSENSSDMSDDARSLLRERWQKGRSTMTERASKLGELNRSVYQGIIARMPKEQIRPLQNFYEQKAFPDVFEDDSIADEQIDAVMGIESLTPQQRMDIGDLTLDYRSDYRVLTDRMVEQVRVRQTREQSWPPDGDAMKSYMKIESLRFQREQLNERIRIMMEMLLTDQQIAEVPGLGDPSEAEDMDS